MKKLVFIVVTFICYDIIAQVNIFYTYDNLQRLVFVRYDDGKQIFYIYDDIGNRTGMILSIPCQSPDLVISNINITKYTPDKIHYTLQIKNQGPAWANLSSFAFAGYNAPSAIRNGQEEFRYAFYPGGGLAPNATMNINFSSNFNYNSTKYYLILSADYSNAVIECVESNNDLAKLVNPCTSNSDIKITGSHSNKLISSNGDITLENATLNNVLVVGKSTTQIPNLTMQNSSVVLGGCLNLNQNSLQSEDTDNHDEYSSNFERSFIEELNFDKNSNIRFTLLKPEKLSINVFGNTEKMPLRYSIVDKQFTAKEHILRIDTSDWVKGNRYTIHISNNLITEAIVVDW